MDPTANLKEQLELARETVDGSRGPDMAQLAELVLALHEWLERGGAVPEQWRDSGKVVMRGKRAGAAAGDYSALRDEPRVRR